MHVFDLPAFVYPLGVHVGLVQPKRQQSPRLHSTLQNVPHPKSYGPNVDQLAFWPFVDQFWLNLLYFPLWKRGIEGDCLQMNLPQPLFAKEGLYLYQTLPQVQPTTYDHR